MGCCIGEYISLELFYFVLLELAIRFQHSVGCPRSGPLRTSVLKGGIRRWIVCTDRREKWVVYLY